ncbi:MAG: type III secretion inner membrane ring lipoprotein SctJ [Parachlamydiaceae bacterium]|nr:type III secretion inner membrane ring lipoprotein SctJ [Parachlamydiaceae bacterium]
MNKTPLIRSWLRFLPQVFLFLMISFLLTSCESRKVIVNGLEEKEANEILVFLSNKGIDATKVKAETEGGGGAKAVMWNISVESSRTNEAMAYLNQAGLPRRRSQNLLNIFSNTSLVPSGMQEKIRYQAGLAEQIASTIRKIDGILDADVQISYPTEDPLNPTAEKEKATASVYVKHSGVLDDPNAHLITRIKRLVAASVNGLDYDNVTVIGDRARYSETPLGSFQGSLNEDERPFVNVWSIIVAQDSVGRFQTFFFSFIVIILLLLSLLIWLLWKFFPLVQELGGFKKLFTLASFHSDMLKEKKEQDKQKEAASKKEDSENEIDDEDQGET